MKGFTRLFYSVLQETSVIQYSSKKEVLQKQSMQIMDI